MGQDIACRQFLRHFSGLLCFRRKCSACLSLLSTFLNAQSSEAVLRDAFGVLIPLFGICNFETLIVGSDHSYLKKLNAKPNEKLYEQLVSWRDKIAENEKVMPDMIFSEKALALIAEKLPATIKALSSIKGVGPAKATQYGPDLILMIRAYEQESKGPVAEQSSLF